MKHFDTGHHQVNADDYPDLYSHGALAGTEECFDTQILFNPLEEQFNLPTAFVNGRDGLCLQLEVVSQKGLPLKMNQLHNLNGSLTGHY